MAAPTNAAKHEKSPCHHGAVHTGHETDIGDPFPQQNILVNNIVQLNVNQNNKLPTHISGCQSSLKEIA
jgi:hypothetical protein